METARLICPICHAGRLADSNIYTKSLLKPADKVTSGWVPDYILKCPKCKNNVAVKKCS